MKLVDMAFVIFAATVVLWIIWELIPDPAKKYWNYLRMVRKDFKQGKPRKYTFSFRNGIGTGRNRER